MAKAKNGRSPSRSTRCSVGSCPRTSATRPTQEFLRSDVADQERMRATRALFGAD